MSFKMILGTAAGLVLGTAALAQTPPKTLSLGNAAAGAPILTRDQLRACMQQGDSMRSRQAELEQRRAPLAQEKSDLAAARGKLEADRAPIDDFKRQAEDLSARMKAYGARVQTWNDNVAAFNADPPAGSRADKVRDDLNAERGQLEKLKTGLEGERAALSTNSERAVAAYNAAAEALGKRVQDWNQRNEAWIKQATALDDERSTWTNDCANRRYREDDEKAIQSGK